MKYIALLRGINVGGNSKVSMAELKICFKQLGCRNVLTYINSGNVIFDYAQTDAAKLSDMCESAIEKQFGFHIVCTLLSANELLEALKHAPKWWDSGDGKHNAIFVIAPKTVEEIMSEVGEAKPEYELVAAHQPIIFWSAPIKTFSRTRYSKIVGTKAYQFITIRSANTTKKLAELCQKD